MFRGASAPPNPLSGNSSRRSLGGGGARLEMPGATYCSTRSSRGSGSFTANVRPAFPAPPALRSRGLLQCHLLCELLQVLSPLALLTVLCRARARAPVIRKHARYDHAPTACCVQYIQVQYILNKHCSQNLASDSSGGSIFIGSRKHWPSIHESHRRDVAYLNTLPKGSGL